ncbi:DUF1206 domain-containing protein (plasmid) [Deinococcus sp. KNUC1210]|uniref:DUF1206 domain-containing protein n=1 Tax=Deinococcus sp. KNUC1210 TaxID=2917691 RepID=UPI001EF03B37|nr:DUF1206 domain-containing protein [Deinococcus sp. KNUC1210]ULH17692.1 DUF1206 domain-containing protein [Deinococcus sp. KNUC1210]
MPTVRNDAVHATQQALQDTAEQAAPGLEGLARLGYAGKGVLYLTIGLLALLQATHRPGGEVTDQRGAMTAIDHLPGGSFLLILLGLGLAGYAVWQVIRALLDPERQGHSPHGLIKRAGYLLSAGSYLALAIAATVRMPTRGTGAQTRDWTAQLLHLPGGRILVGLIGVAVLAVAANELRLAVTASFMAEMDLSGPGQTRRTMVERVGRVGIAARAVVFAVIGWFFLQAAWKAASTQAGGVKDALDALASSPFGPGLLALIAAGLILYGVYCEVLAVYRRIHIAPASPNQPSSGAASR